jgi:hypothetical protein
LQLLQAILFTPSFRWAAPIHAAACAASPRALRGLACTIQREPALAESARVLCRAAVQARDT